MKKIFFLILFCTLLLGTNSVKASMTYEEALNLSKPIAILVYANWATDTDKALAAFNELEKTYEAKYNFVPLNIADETTKPFNDVYHIYPKLPYMLLFRDKGKFSRYLQKDCLLNKSCVEERMNFFAN